VAAESAEDHDTDIPLPFESPSLGACYAGAVQGRIALGHERGAPITRIGRQPDAPFVTLAGARCAAQDGFTLHAGVHISGSDRERLERLCRYMARPAVASERLSRCADGTIKYRLRKPFADGTTAVRFDPLTFLEKLAALVPPPRAHLVTYHGVLAPNATWRDAVVPDAAPGIPLARRRNHHHGEDDQATEDPETRSRRYTWAELLLRVFRIDLLECPHCHGQRRVIALITDPPVIRAILTCLDLDPDPPSLHPPRWPP
jgi:Putative transposase